jgi:putative ABC transport system permease protein
MTLEQITTSESMLSLNVTAPSAELALNNQKNEEIARIANVESVSPLAMIPGQINFINLTSGTSLYMCNPDYFKFGGVISKEGELFKSNEEKTIVFSSALLASFKIEAKDAIGKEVKISLFMPKKDGINGETETVSRNDTYRIIGVVDDDTTSFGYVPLGSFSDLGISNYDQVQVKITQAKLLDGAVEELEKMGYLVSSLSETINEANQIFTAVQLTLSVFGLVSLLVGAIGMANTMTVTLLERTNEIGIMKALGAASKDIGGMFLTESLIMGFLGGFGGISIGLILTESLNLAINIWASSMGGQAVRLFYAPMWFIIFIFVFSTVVGFLSGVFPSQKAAKMNPLEALRYK